MCDMFVCALLALHLSVWCFHSAMLCPTVLMHFFQQLEVMQALEIQVLIWCCCYFAAFIVVLLFSLTLALTCSCTHILAHTCTLPCLHLHLLTHTHARTHPHVSTQSHTLNPSPFIPFYLHSHPHLLLPALTPLLALAPSLAPLLETLSHYTSHSSTQPPFTFLNPSISPRATLLTSFFPSPLCFLSW